MSKLSNLWQKDDISNRRLKGDAVSRCGAQMVYLQCWFGSADFFPFLRPTIVCLFFFTEVKMSIIVVICVPSPLSTVVFLSSPCCYSSCSSPQAAPSPHSCQLLETTLTRSSHLCVTHHGNKCVHIFEDCNDGACFSDFPPHIVRPSNHPPTPPTPHRHPAVAVSTSVENGTINDIIVLDAVLLSVLWMWPPRDRCSCPDHPYLREDAAWHQGASRPDYKLFPWSDFRKFILDVTV